DGHADIDSKVEKQDARNTVGIDAGEGGPLAFGDIHDTQQQGQVNADNDHRTYESPFFTYGAEDKIRTLLRYKVVLRLRTLQVTFPPELTGSDGNHRLVEVVALPAGVVNLAQKHIDTVALVRLQHII